MTNMSKRLGAFLGATALTLIAGMGMAQAQEKHILRMNHVHSPVEAYHSAFQEWAKRVEERTKGGLKIEVFHSAQLGNEEDIIEQIRQGANIGQNTDAARLGNYVREIAVLNGPYFVDTLDEAFALSKLDTVKKWKTELADKHGLQVVCFDFVQGKRHVFANKPVRNPGDLSGLRIRTPPAPIWQESVRAIGAAPTAMSFGDIYPGLQQRAVDGAELTYANIRPGNLQEVVKNVSETGHITLINFEVVSSAWFKKLPADYQTALVEECSAAGQKVSKVLADAAEGEKAALVKGGMKVTENVDLEAFRKAGDAAYQKLGLTEVRAAVYKEMGR
ncbi:C4-dicarboxylate ABC transporter [Azospirillum brasilense]|uniref:C4-dicarboxylate ABC transporter n=2 Tax=Azospirillum brasilense TaxID=192 RepID=A0A6L3ASY3_AZOBR|nr:C4-dicarboxylate ABC transporter [Azospirillum brasilense]